MGRPLKIRRTNTGSVILDIQNGEKRTTTVIDTATWSFLIAYWGGSEPAYSFLRKKARNTTKEDLRFEILSLLNPSLSEKAAKYFQPELPLEQAK